MNNLGFYKVCAYVPEVRIADVDFNVGNIIRAIEKGEREKIDCMVFPELSVTGYTCADLFEQELLTEKTLEGIDKIRNATKDLEILVAVGAPVMTFGRKYNCAVIISSNKILGIVPKSHIPNYSEFYEKRWFESGEDIKYADIVFGSSQVPFGTDLIFQHKGVKIGVEICEDLWVPQPPSGKLAMAGAEVILNLSASDELIGKNEYIRSLISQQSAGCRCVYVYSSAGWGESSTDLVFSGKAMIGEDGIVTGSNKRFENGAIETVKTVDIEKLRHDRSKFSTFFDDAPQDGNYKLIESSSDGIKKTESNEPTGLKNDRIERDFELPEIELEVDPYPFVPSDLSRLNERCEEILNIQAYGLMKRLSSIGCHKAIIGISGGLDSTLALLVTVRAFDKLKLSRKGIIGVTMPGLATTSRTRSNAHALMDELGVTAMEIPILQAVTVHFKDIGQDPEKYDATYENSQARERTQILMDLANKENGIVIGTGDMSELALGWCTYNGDHMSMYGVNASVPKTLVRHLVNRYALEAPGKIAAILNDIVATPISPELVPSGSDEISQKTEDLVGPYDLHDFFLYHFLRNSFRPFKIFVMARKAFENKFDDETILKWEKIFFRRFFSQQFKRSSMPDGPKVGSVSLSPRGDWRMASDSSAALWINEIELLEEQIKKGK